MTTVLVLGGVRSGKSAYAESLLRDRHRVSYLAPGHAPTGDDPEWLARIAAHRQRRPGHWSTREGGDVPAYVAAARPGEAVLLDCLGTWLARLVDDADAWSRADDARALVECESGRLAQALGDCAGDVVVVSNEVGLGVVPATSSGRLFRDLLGVVNRVVADTCGHLTLVVTGRVLDLSGTPRLADGPSFGLRGGAADAPGAGIATPGAVSDRQIDDQQAMAALGSLGAGIDIWEDAGLADSAGGTRRAPASTQGPFVLGDPHVPAAPDAPDVPEIPKASDAPDARKTNGGNPGAPP